MKQRRRGGGEGRWKRCGNEEDGGKPSGGTGKEGKTGRRGSLIITDKYLLVPVGFSSVICPLNCFILQFGGALVKTSLTDSIPQHIYAVNLTQYEVKHSMMGDVKPIKDRQTAADMAVSDFPPPANTDIVRLNKTGGGGAW